MMLIRSLLMSGFVAKLTRDDILSFFANNLFLIIKFFKKLFLIIFSKRKVLKFLLTALQDFLRLKLQFLLPLLQYVT